MSDPETIFLAATAAVNRRDWQAAAALCDPVSLAVFKRDLLARVEMKPRMWTAEQLLQHQPDLPSEVAAYHAARLNETTDAKQVLEREVPSVTSVEQLRQMSPVDVFAAWLEGQSFERQLEVARREASIPAEM